VGEGDAISAEEGCAPTSATDRGISATPNEHNKALRIDVLPSVSLELAFIVDPLCISHPSLYGKSKTFTQKSNEILILNKLIISKHFQNVIR